MILIIFNHSIDEKVVQSKKNVFMDEKSLKKIIYT